MFAATAAGIYEKVEDAMKALGKGFDIAYYPDSSHAAIYAKGYKKYQSIGKFMEQLNGVTLIIFFS